MARIYLDSCLIIYLHEGTRDIQERIFARMRSMPTTTNYCITDLVVLECLVGPMKRNDKPLLADYNAFFELSEILVLPMNSSVFRLAAEIRAMDGLKTPDALHVAAAIQAGCSSFWTSDDEIGRVGNRIGVEHIVMQ